MHTKDVYHLSVALHDHWDKDKMSDSPHRLCPSGSLVQRQDGGCSLLPLPPIPEPNRTKNNDRLRKLQCMCHTAPLFCCAGLGFLLVLALFYHFGCWTRFYVAAPRTTAWTAQPCSAQLCSAPFSPAALGFSPAWIPCGIYPLAPSLSLSTTYMPCFSAFQHHGSEPQLRQMGKGWIVMAEGRVCRADPDNLPIGDRERQNVRFSGVWKFFLPPRSAR